MSANQITIRIDGEARQVPTGSTLAAVLASEWTRISRTRQTRAPLCGMGVCFECRVTVDGLPHQRACQITVREGMEVRREA